MKDFLQLNKSKLIATLKTMLVVFIILVLLFFAIGYLVGFVPQLNTFLGALFGVGVGVPLFILFVGTLRGIWDLKKRRKIFSQPLFSELIKNGFEEKLKNDNNKWLFYEPFLIGKIKEFDVVIEIDTQFDSSTILFKGLTEMTHISKDEYNKLQKKLAVNNIEFDFNGLTKKMGVKDIRVKHFTDVVKELEQLIQQVKELNFKPKKSLLDTENTKKKAHVTFYPNKIIVTTYDTSNTGLSLISSKLTKLPTDVSPNILGETLRRHFTLTENNLNHPKCSQAFKRLWDDYKEVAGFKSNKETYMNVREISCLLVNEKIIITPCENKYDTSFFPILNLKRSIESNCTNEILGLELLKAKEDAIG